MTVPADITANVERVRNRIADAGGDPDRITLVAVTKAHGPDIVGAALAARLHDLGENYAQELVTKAATSQAAPSEGQHVRWHFIGQLQRNKVRSIAHLVDLWQTVDRLTLGEEIATRAPGASVLVQVNLTDDAARGGTKPSMVPGLVDGLRDLGLDVRGLMAVGPQGGPDAAEEGFARVVALADRLDLPVRSLGMTGDIEVAVRAGTTMLRVGTGLFGSRERRSRVP